MNALARFLLGSAALAAFVGVWHVASVTGLFGRVPPEYAALLLPTPGAVWEALRESVASGDLWNQVSVSLVRVATGFGLSVLIGVPLGLSVALSPTANALIDPFVRIFSPIPGVAWVPLAILWFGLGDKAAIFIITIGSVFPILLSTAQGVRAVDRSLLDAARTLGARFHQQLRRVLLPSVTPFLVTGFRLGLGFAWRVVIAAEMVGVPRGIGYMLNVGRSTGHTEVTFMTIAILGVLMIIAEEVVFAPLERWTNHWRPAVAR
jgi:NitT/TauT family transport system permease protein/taurine transport system permease protein/sulfonate transport system permease protein